MSNGVEWLERVCNEVGGTVQEGEHGAECDVDVDEVRVSKNTVTVVGEDGGVSYIDHPESVDFSSRSDDWRTDTDIRLNGMGIESLPSGYDPAFEFERDVEIEIEVSEYDDWMSMEVKGSGTIRR